MDTLDQIRILQKSKTPYLIKQVRHFECSINVTGFIIYTSS